MGIPIPLGVMLPAVILFLSLTYIFFTILLFIRDQMGKIYQSIRTHPKDSSWLFGLYIGTYVITCSLMVTGLEAVIRFDGVFVLIYLASIIANLISLWQISKWLFAKRVQRLDIDRDLVKYIEEVKARALHLFSAPKGRGERIPY